NGEPLTFRTQYSRLVPVRSWFRWLVRNNHILHNPASDLDMPKIEQRLPRAVLSESEAEKVMLQPDLDEVLGVRDRAILETLYSTGIRRTELVNLKLYNLDRERGTLSIWQGKGKKDRIIPMAGTDNGIGRCSWRAVSSGRTVSGSAAKGKTFCGADGSEISSLAAAVVVAAGMFSCTSSPPSSWLLSPCAAGCAFASSISGASIAADWTTLT